MWNRQRYGGTYWCMGDVWGCTDVQGGCTDTPNQTDIPICLTTPTNTLRNTNQPIKKCHIVVLYSQGLCESYKTICSKYGVQIHFKGGNTLEIPY